MKSLLFLLILPLVALAGVDDEWSAIVALDAGPGKSPKTREEAQMQARAHFVRHCALIEEFLSKYPNDPRAWDARLRLAAILAAQGNMDGVPQQVEASLKMLADLEKTPGVPAEKRADAGFRRVSLYMQSLLGREAEMRDSLVAAAKNFVAKYPADRRSPRLLVEAATICDSDPALKRKLLNEARSLSKEDALNHRIADDLVRLNLLDKPLDLTFPTIQGGTFRTAAEKGKVILLVFWSAESPHCLMWMDGFRRALAKLPQAELSIATISLDTDQKALAQRMKEFKIEAWPTNFDRLGWDNAVARPLGINSLPTVFVIDKSGILRTIDARDNPDLWVRRLLRE